MSSGEHMDKAIAEIREWLVRIDTNQRHQTQLLETLNEMTKGAVSTADKAEDTAEKALDTANRVEDDLAKYKEEQATRNRWAIGLGLSSALTLFGFIITIILALI